MPKKSKCERKNENSQWYEVIIWFVPPKPMGKFSF